MKIESNYEFKDHARSVSANALVARLIGEEDLKGLPANQVDVLLPGKLVFRAFLEVPFLPLPQDAEPGVFYLTPDNLFSYIDNGEWVTIETGASYTIEPTKNGWVFKRGNKAVFTYIEPNDHIVVVNELPKTNIQDGVEYVVTDGIGRLIMTYVHENGQWIETSKSGEPSDGAYEIKGELSSFLSDKVLGTTPVDVTNVPTLNPADIVIGETYLYDHKGTMAVVIAYDAQTGVMTAQTMTTSPGERAGVRLGAVEEKPDLPATITDAEGLGWLTPVEGDFAYVRQDGPKGDKLGEWLVQSIDTAGNITWAFSHYINAGNYVVDILTSSGVLIPKNQDGTVTLPVNDRIKAIKLADGTELPVDADYKVTLPDFIRGAVLVDGTVLSVNNKSQIELPDFGTLKGVLTHDGVDLVVDTNGKVTLPKPTMNYELNLDTKDIATAIDSVITLNTNNFTSILSQGKSFTLNKFATELNPNRDLIFIHGLDGATVTQEAIAWFVSVDDPDNPTEFKFKILAIPKAGSGTVTDKEVPEYNRDLSNGDKIGKLELITHDNVLYRATADNTITGNWQTDKANYEAIKTDGASTTNITYNVGRDGQELKSADAVIAGTDRLTSISGGQRIPFVNRPNSTIDQEGDGTWIVPPHSKVEVIMSLALYSANGGSEPNGEWCVREVGYTGTDRNDPRYILGVDPYDHRSNTNNAPGWSLNRTASGHYTNTTDNPVTIEAVCLSISTAGTQIYNATSHITVQEIGRVVDPIAYMLNDGNAQEMPVGSLIQTMSNSAPKHYLICDGSEYAIGTYPELEAHFVKEFGAVNHFGGASGKWKVPDLRGEFLRMTGKNSRANQGSGSVVGAHQNATEHKLLVTDLSKKAVQFVEPSSANNWNSVVSPDTQLKGKRFLQINPTSLNGASTDEYQYAYTSRPTNTSVNVAIKCESTPRVIVDQGTYKASVKCSVAAAPSSGGAQFVFDGSDIIGDTTMVDTTTNEFVAPVDGLYVVGCQTTTSGTGVVSNCLNINGANTCWGRGINPMGTVYLKTGDRVSLNMYGGSSANDGRANIALVNTVEKNIAEVMLKPNTWAVGVEQSFGDGVYGYRTQIASFLITGSANAGTATIPILPASLKAKKVLQWGGTYLNANGYFWNIPGSYEGGNHILYVNNHQGMPNGNDEWSISLDSSRPGTGRDLDVWVLYTK